MSCSRRPLLADALTLRAALGAALLLNACALFSFPDAPRIQSPALIELSGLAASRADATLLWAHNDSGDGPNLYRVGLDGADLGRVTVPGAVAVDWEDIAAFDWHGAPALLIADTGDNNARRDHVTLYAVNDPGRHGEVHLLWRIDLRYPDGARDMEAVAVDPVDRVVILISKRDYPQHLYRLPLPKDDNTVTDAVAESLGTITSVPKATLGDQFENPGFGQWSGEPTALDIAVDGRFAVLTTYKNAYRYARAPGQSWAAVFAATPETIPLPRLRQTEAGAISTDGASLYISSEGRAPPLLRVPLKPP